jgi:hypothetical protein
MEWWQILLIVCIALLLLAALWVIYRRRRARPKYIVTQGEIASFLTEDENDASETTYDDEEQIDYGASKPVQRSFVLETGPTYTVTNVETGQSESFNVRQLPHENTVNKTEFQAALTRVLRNFGENMVQILESGSGLVASNKNRVLARVELA